MVIKNILWDLDGTLTDPKFGIIRCIQYAIERFGKEVPPFEQLFWCIGPPLYESFPKLVPNASREDILMLVDLYRERFSDIGMYENEVYLGIPELLNELQQKHYVATSKPHVFAKKILSHFKLTPFFSNIHGSELNGVRSDKGELIKFILDNESLDPNKTVMIGDRKHDIIGAKKLGLKSIGITWGYGSTDEHVEAGADFIFNTPQELGNFLNSKK